MKNRKQKIKKKRQKNYLISQLMCPKIIRNGFDWLIKQSMMGKKLQIIRDKLKDKTNNDIWILFDTEKEDKKKKQ